MKKVLIVDDDPNISELLRLYFDKDGFAVITCYDGISAYDIFVESRPDVVILDLMLPGRDGYDIMRDIRRSSDTPVIMLTARGDTLDKVVGLELGADDYVQKPFEPKELMARVKAVLRRTSARSEEKDEITFDNLSINLVKHEVRKNGQVVELKPKEFDLLKLMATNPGKVFTRDFLLEQLWGYDYLGDTRTVDVHMRRLRQKIEDEPSSPRQLKTVHGIGYKFQFEEQTD